MKKYQKKSNYKSLWIIAGMIVCLQFLFSHIVIAQTKEIISKNIGILKYIPGGTFHHNRKNDADTTTVSAFYISQYEITQTQYIAIIHTKNPSWNVMPNVLVNKKNRPVEYVLWYDTVEFCNKLSVLEGLIPVYTITGKKQSGKHPFAHVIVTMNMANNGYRLPTEAEWQWAAMGATDNCNKAFSGSTGMNNINDYAWYNKNSNHLDSSNINYGTHEVGTKLPNELGLYDMSGNVFEWCWDLLDFYPEGSLTNPTGAITGIDRVARGGGWVSDAIFCAVYTRNGGFPDGRLGDVGFRVVLRP